MTKEEIKAKISDIDKERDAIVKRMKEKNSKAYGWCEDWEYRCLKESLLAKDMKVIELKEELAHAE